jgi:hypothetical protein
VGFHNAGKAAPDSPGNGPPLKLSSLGGVDPSSITQNPAPAQDKFRNPRAVREARRQLNLEFLHECAGGIAVHAGLVQTFAEIGDTAGVCYAMRRLFAHARAAHTVYVELRDEPHESAP